MNEISSFHEVLFNVAYSSEGKSATTVLGFACEGKTGLFVVEKFFHDAARVPYGSVAGYNPWK
jgi:hypothetical protein